MKRWLAMLSVGLMALSLSTAVLAQQANQGAKARAGAAQQGRRDGGGGLRGLDQAIKSLNLTAEQKPKVEAALNSAREEMKKIREGQGTPQERRPKMQAAMKNLQTKLDSILTESQKKQLKEKMAEVRQNRRPESAGAPAGKK